MTMPRNLAKDELREREDYFAQLVARSPLAMLVATGQEQRVGLLNAKFSELFGYTLDDIPDVAHWWPLAYPDPAYREEIKSKWSARAARAIEAAGEIEPMETTVTCNDGSRRHIEFRMSLIGENNLVTFADLTERKRVEDALRASEERLQLQVQRMPIGLIVWSPDFRVQTWNPAAEQIFGFSADEAMGKHPYELIVPGQAQAQVNAIWARLLEGDTTASSVNENQTKDGRTIICEWHNTPLRKPDGTVAGALAMVQDITERKRTELALANAVRALRTLSACNMALVRARDESEILSSVCRLIVETGGYRLAWVGVPEQNAAKTVRPVAQYGYEDGYFAAAKISWADNELGRGPTGTAIRTGAVQVNQNFLTNPALLPWREAARQRGYQSSIALPLKGTSGDLGVLTIYAQETDAFEEEEVKLLQELADDLTFGIETLRTRADRDRIAYEQQHHEEILRRSLEDSIKAIAATVEMRDPYTAGHQRRVGQLAVAIARELGIGEHSIHGIELAASIHDVGKINVPAEILSKPSRLNDIELMLVKSHAQAGYDILKEIKFPWPIATMVWQHHERLDGSGYPQGLKGAEIPIESRIMAVADVVEAMASHRPYRPALGIKVALKEVERGRGTVYDEAVVDACIRLFREKRFAFAS